MTKAYSYVRLSSDAQTKGDGHRRQLEQSREYASTHGLELDESFVRQGRAESAFRGHNATAGALGRFLDACESRQIERGSFLLIESIDRLSRQEVFKSLALFMRLMTAGITIVTLIDGRRYNIDSSGEGDILMMIGAMTRAHDESKTKSLRSGKNWAQKRATISQRKMTAMAPAWLKLSRDKKSFTIIEDRAETVRRIFGEAVAGIGMYTITKRLNDENVPTFGRSRGWHQSYVAKILMNPAVHGEFQPHHTENGERKPYGPPVPDYYPTVIERETFFLAQGGRHQRRQNGAGRKGNQISNLFTGLVRCGYCDSRMHFENKGPSPKGGQYLVCEAGLRSHQCVPIRWRYDEFEASFLAFVEELDLGSLLATKEQASKKAQLEMSIASLNGQLQTLRRERERAYELLRNSSISLSFVEEKLVECEQNISSVESSLEPKNQELSELSEQVTADYSDKEELRRLIEHVRNRIGDDVYKDRAQIASRLKAIVSSVSVYADGRVPERDFYRRWLESEKNNPTHDPIIAELLAKPEALTEITEKDRLRYFIVGFNDRNYRRVYPSDDDPLKFESQLVGVGERIVAVSSDGQQRLLSYNRWTGALTE